MPLLVCPTLKLSNMQKNPNVQNGYIKITAIDTVIRILVPSRTHSPATMCQILFCMLYKCQLT